MSSSLRALLDGQPLPPDEAHTLWTRFSAYMDENQGDFAGFAAALGFTEAKVGMVDGQPTLQLSSRGGSGDARSGPNEPKAQTKPKAKGPKPHRKPGGKKAGAKKPGRGKPKSGKPGANKPQKTRRDRSVDIGDAKPKRPGRK